MSRRRWLWVAPAALVVAGALARLVVLSHSATGILGRPIIRAHGKPDNAEVAIRVRNVYLGKHPVAATCTESSTANWTCIVRLSNGRTGKVRAVWYRPTEKLTVTLDAPGFRS